MAEIASTFSMFTKIILMVISAEAANGACQPASHEYQLHQGNEIAFFPSPIQDNVLKDTIYWRRNASSDVVCAVYCLQEDSCKSFNYCNGNLCQLKTVNYSVKGSEVQTSAACRHYGDEDFQAEAPSTTPLPCCRNYTTEHMLSQVEEPLDLPMRLEFSVKDPGFARVYFSFDSRGMTNAAFALSLTISKIRTYKAGLVTFNVTDITDTFGKQYFVTYSNGRFESGVKGVDTFDMTYTMPSPPDTDQEMFIVLHNLEFTEWCFFQPCTYFNLTKSP